MGHAITGVVVSGAFDRGLAQTYDLVPALERDGLALLPIDHYYTAYWATRGKDAPSAESPGDVPAIFPGVGPLLALLQEITGNRGPRFAIIMTDYFGGVGSQHACVFEGGRRVDTSDVTINTALAWLGLARAEGLDEFDTFGLGKHRQNPEYLDRYRELCDELGA